GSPPTASTRSNRSTTASYSSSAGSCTRCCRSAVPAATSPTAASPSTAGSAASRRKQGSLEGATFELVTPESRKPGQPLHHLPWLPAFAEMTTRVCHDRPSRERGGLACCGCL